MASLALLVSFIFLMVLLSGPLSLFFLHFNFYTISGIFAIIAITLGVFWTLSTPLPISIIGAISIAMGVAAFMRM